VISKALAVYRKELQQISRDRRTLTTIVFVPAFFLLLYGYALNWDIRHIALVVQDRDATPERKAKRSGAVKGGHWGREPEVHGPSNEMGPAAAPGPFRFRESRLRPRLDPY